MHFKPTGIASMDQYSLSLQWQEEFSQGSERSDNLVTPVWLKVMVVFTIAQTISGEILFQFPLFFLADLLIGPKEKKKSSENETLQLLVWTISSESYIWQECQRNLSSLSVNQKIGYKLSLPFGNHAQESFQGASNHSTTPHMKGLKKPYF